jgi:hypothetical protein
MARARTAGLAGRRTEPVDGATHRLNRCVSGSQRNLVDMAKFRRTGAVLLTIEVMLSLSACGRTTPAAVGSYKATIACTTNPGPASPFPCNAKSLYSLVISANGQFIMKYLGHPGGAFKGTWSQTKDRVTLSENKGTTKIEFVALQNGTNLREGRIEVPGGHVNVGYILSWYAVRI